jgi:DNA-directed RNA polymerase specialized sigma24 family protein
MSAMPDRDEAVRLAYQIAVDALPPVPRVIFLLHRVDELPYEAIARRLSIGIPAVESGLARALVLIGCALDGDTPVHVTPEPLAQAQAALRQRHRRYCEGQLRALGAALPIAWDDDCDDDATVMRTLLLSLPPAVLDTFLLNRVDHLSYAEVATRMRTFQWIVRRRMLHAIRRVATRPMMFEEWLEQQAAST